MDRQSPYVQGYRLFYRPSGGTWLLQDINSPSERSTVLTGMLKGTEYEIKIRPYFDEFQGKDSRTLLIRTREEGNLLLSPISAVDSVRLQGFKGLCVSDLHVILFCCLSLFILIRSFIKFFPNSLTHAARGFLLVGAKFSRLWIDLAESQVCQNKLGA